MKSSIELKKNEIIDSHTHCGGVLLSNLLSGSYPYSQNTLDLVRKMYTNKVKYSICFPFPVGEQYGGLFTPELYNGVLAKEVYTFGDNSLLPFAFIRLDDTLSRQIKYIEQLLKDYSFYGIKIYPPCDKYCLCDHYVEKSLTPFLIAHDFPLISHTSFSGFGNPDIILRFAEIHPNIRITLAHAARFKSTVLSQLMHFPNVFIDCSPLHMLCAVMQKKIKKDNEVFNNFSFDNPPQLLFQLATMFPDQLIWGTDSPCTFLTNFSENAIADYSPQYSYESEISVLHSLPESYIHKIANINTLRFLNG